MVDGVDAGVRVFGQYAREQQIDVFVLAERVQDMERPERPHFPVGFFERFVQRGYAHGDAYQLTVVIFQKGNQVQNPDGEVLVNNPGHLLMGEWDEVENVVVAFV